MSDMSATETCSCGARFVVTGAAVHIAHSLKTWRETHRHEVTLPAHTPENGPEQGLGAPDTPSLVSPDPDEAERRSGRLCVACGRRRDRYFGVWVGPQGREAAK